MSKDSKKDELVGRTLVLTTKKGKSLKYYGTVVYTETKGNETKLIFDTDKEYYEKKKRKEFRSEGKGDFRAWIRSLERLPKLS
jgi:hypothetical protein